MKTTLNSALLTAVMLLTSVGANAAVVCNGSTQCEGPAIEIITSLFPSPTGGVLIGSASTVAGLPCTGASGGNNVFLPSTHANYRETFATLLTASVAGNDVILRIDTNESACTLYFARMLN